MKRIAAIFQCIVSLLILLHPATALAVPAVIPVPAKPAPSPLLITGFHFADAKFQYVQIYNNTDKAVNLSGWHMQIQDDGMVVGELSFPDKYIIPREYIAVADSSLNIQHPDIEFRLPRPLSTTILNDTIRLTPPDATISPETVTLKIEKDSKGNVINNHYQSRQALSQSTAGNYTTTSVFKPEPTDNDLFGKGFYSPLLSFSLVPIEILANPRSCSPTEKTNDCTEYVKFYNDSPLPVQLDDVRLRAGYQGQSSTASNTTDLSGILQPYGYTIIPIGLTNTGGYVWVEDSYGVKTYETTVIEYPDASSTTHKGQSWAMNKGGNWEWMQPSPDGENTPLPTVEDNQTETTKQCNADQYLNPLTGRCKKYEASTVLAPCDEDQERNPATGRCRKIAGVATSLTPCKVGEYRSPETGRCRKVTTVAAPTPCKPGQIRNPETNRCRSVLASASGLKPCQAGWERNPETNRCRKLAKQSDTTVGFKPEKTAPSTDTVTTWWVFAGLGTFILGYAGWEWRHEIVRATSTLFKYGGPK